VEQTVLDVVVHVDTMKFPSGQLEHTEHVRGSTSSECARSRERIMLRRLTLCIVNLPFLNLR
jgi:hypothetical protein